MIGDEKIQEYLHGTLADLPSGRKMKDLEKAAEILEKKIQEGCRIRIIGDYDIDGVTSTTILLKGLKRLGQKWIPVSRTELKMVTESMKHHDQ